VGYVFWDEEGAYKIGRTVGGLPVFKNG